MGRRKYIYFLLLLFLVLAIKVFALPAVLEDPVDDLYNIWTGEKSGLYLGFVDVVRVEYGVSEAVVSFGITLGEDLPVEGKVFFYLIIDTNGLSEDNCLDPPFDGGDVMYGIVYEAGELNVERSTYEAWGWSEAVTEAYASMAAPNGVVVYIPVLELGEELGVQKWKLVTEYSGEEAAGIGDFVPDEGTVELWPTVKEALLTVIVSPYVESVVVDGVSYTPVNGTVSVYVTVGEHKVFVPSEVEVRPGVRVVFEKWFDGVETAERVVYVAEGGATLEALYATYYKVSISSPIGKVCCPGWYREGSTVNISLAPTVVVEDNGTRFIFERWSGYWGENSFVEDKPGQVILHLRDSINISAFWRTEYYLKVVSKYGAPSGEGWYVAGSQARVSVDRELVFDNETKAIFKRWTGDIESTQPSLMLTMDGPKLLKAEWLTLYQVTVTFVDVDGNPVNPDSVEVSGPGGPYSCEPVESSCVFWFGEGGYEISKVDYMGVDVAEDTEIEVSKPLVIEVSLPIYDVVIEVENFFGQPMEGVEVELTFPSGETLVNKTDSTGVVRFEDVPAGQYKVSTKGLVITSGQEFMVDENVEVELGGNVGWGEGALISVIVISVVGLFGFVIYKGGLFYGGKPGKLICCCPKWKFGKDCGIKVDIPFHKSPLVPVILPTVVVRGDVKKRAEPKKFMGHVFVPYNGHLPLVARASDNDTIEIFCKAIDCATGGEISICKVKLPLPDTVQYRWEIVEGRGSFLTYPPYTHTHSPIAVGPAAVYVAPPPPKCNNYNYVEKRKLLSREGEIWREGEKWGEFKQIQETVKIKLVVDDLQRKVEGLDDPNGLKPVEIPIEVTVVDNAILEIIKEELKKLKSSLKELSDDEIRKLPDRLVENIRGSIMEDAGAVYPPIGSGKVFKFFELDSYRNTILPVVDCIADKAKAERVRSTLESWLKAEEDKNVRYKRLKIWQNMLQDQLIDEENMPKVKKAIRKEINDFVKSEKRARELWSSLVKEIRDALAESRKADCFLNVKWHIHNPIEAEIVFPQPKGDKPSIVLTPGQVVILEARAKDTDALEIVCKKSAGESGEKIAECSVNKLELNDKLFYEWESKWEGVVFGPNWNLGIMGTIEESVDIAETADLIDAIERTAGPGYFLLTRCGRKVVFKAPYSEGTIKLICRIRDSGLQAYDGEVTVETTVEVRGKTYYEELKAALRELNDLKEELAALIYGKDISEDKRSKFINWAHSEICGWVMKPPLGMNESFIDVLGSVLTGDYVKKWNFTSGLLLALDFLEEMKDSYTEALQRVVIELKKGAAWRTLLSILSIAISIFAAIVFPPTGPLAAYGIIAQVASLGLSLASMGSLELLPSVEVPDPTLGMVFETNIEGLKKSPKTIRPMIEMIKFIFRNTGEALAQRAREALSEARRIAEEVGEADGMFFYALAMRDLAMLGIEYYRDLYSMAWNLFLKLSNWECIEEFEEGNLEEILKQISKKIRQMEDEWRRQMGELFEWLYKEEQKALLSRDDKVIKKVLEQVYRKYRARLKKILEEKEFRKAEIRVLMDKLNRLSSSGPGLIEKIEELMYRWREVEAYLRYLCV